jgi:hypothetical protein
LLSGSEADEAEPKLSKMQQFFSAANRQID